MPGTVQFRQTVHELLTDEDTRWMFVATIAIGALATGYATGSVLAGEALADQRWLALVAVGLGSGLLTLSGAVGRADSDGA